MWMRLGNFGNDCSTYVCNKKRPKFIVINTLAARRSGDPFLHCRLSTDMALSHRQQVRMGWSVRILEGTFGAFDTLCIVVTWRVQCYKQTKQSTSYTFRSIHMAYTTSVLGAC